MRVISDIDTTPSRSSVYSSF